MILSQKFFRVKTEVSHTHFSRTDDPFQSKGFFWWVAGLVVKQKQTHQLVSFIKNTQPNPLINQIFTIKIL